MVTKDIKTHLLSFLVVLTLEVEVSSGSGGGDLKCSVRDAAVRVQVQLSPQIFQNKSDNKNNSWTFRTTDENTWNVEDYTDCTRGTNNTLNCSVWSGETPNDIVTHHYHSPYRLQIIHTSTGRL